MYRLRPASRLFHILICAVLPSRPLHILIYALLDSEKTVFITHMSNINTYGADSFTSSMFISSKWPRSPEKVQKQIFENITRDYFKVLLT